MKVHETQLPVPSLYIVSEAELLANPKYDDWYHKGQLQGCWCCGSFSRGIDRHHIVKPLRSWDIANLALLCRMCHQAAEGCPPTVQIAREPVKWPKLTMSHVLWLKRERDPDNYNRHRLEELYGKRLPRAARPPEVLLEMRERRRRAW